MLNCNIRLKRDKRNQHADLRRKNMIDTDTICLMKAKGYFVHTKFIDGNLYFNIYVYTYK